MDDDLDAGFVSNALSGYGGDDRYGSLAIGSDDEDSDPYNFDLKSAKKKKKKKKKKKDKEPIMLQRRMSREERTAEIMGKLDSERRTKGASEYSDTQQEEAAKQAAEAAQLLRDEEEAEATACQHEQDLQMQDLDDEDDMEAAEDTDSLDISESDFKVGGYSEKANKVIVDEEDSNSTTKKDTNSPVDEFKKRQNLDDFKLDNAATKSSRSTTPENDDNETRGPERRSSFAEARELMHTAATAGRNRSDEEHARASSRDDITVSAAAVTTQRHDDDTDTDYEQGEYHDDEDCEEFSNEQEGEGDVNRSNIRTDNVASITMDDSASDNALDVMEGYCSQTQDDEETLSMSFAPHTATDDQKGSQGGRSESSFLAETSGSLQFAAGTTAAELGTTTESTDAETRDSENRVIELGTRVSAKLIGWSHHYSGQILERNTSDGTYKVLFDDGELMDAVAVDDMVVDPTPQQTDERSSSAFSLETTTLDDGNGSNNHTVTDGNGQTTPPSTNGLHTAGASMHTPIKHKNADSSMLLDKVLQGELSPSALVTPPPPPPPSQSVSQTQRSVFSPPPPPPPAHYQQQISLPTNIKTISSAKPATRKDESLSPTRTNVEDRRRGAEKYLEVSADDRARIERQLGTIKLKYRGGGHSPHSNASRTPRRSPTAQQTTSTRTSNKGADRHHGTPSRAVAGKKTMTARKNWYTPSGRLQAPNDIEEERNRFALMVDDLQEQVQHMDESKQQLEEEWKQERAELLNTLEVRDADIAALNVRIEELEHVSHLRNLLHKGAMVTKSNSVEPPLRSASEITPVMLQSIEKEMQSQERLIEGFQRENEKMMAKVKDAERLTEESRKALFRENKRLGREVNALDNLQRSKGPGTPGMFRRAHSDDQINTQHVENRSVTTNGFGDGLNNNHNDILRSGFVQHGNNDSNLATDMLREQMGLQQQEYERRLGELKGELDDARRSNKEAECRAAGLGGLDQFSQDVKVQTEAVDLLKQELDKAREEHAREAQTLQEKLSWYAENQELLSKNEVLIDEQQELIVQLREHVINAKGKRDGNKWKPASKRQAEVIRKAVADVKSKAKVGGEGANGGLVVVGGGARDAKNAVMRSRPSDIRKIRTLETQVKDLTEALRKRNPDCIANLIAAAGPTEDQVKEQALLRKQVEILEDTVSTRQADHDATVRALRQEYEKVHAQHTRAQEQLRLFQQSRHGVAAGGGGGVARKDTAPRICALEEELDRVRKFYRHKLEEQARKVQLAVRKSQANQHQSQNNNNLEDVDFAHNGDVSKDGGGGKAHEAATAAVGVGGHGIDVPRLQREVDRLQAINVALLARVEETEGELSRARKNKTQSSGRDPKQSGETTRKPINSSSSNGGNGSIEDGSGSIDPLTLSVVSVPPPPPQSSPPPTPSAAVGTREDMSMKIVMDRLAHENRMLRERLRAQLKNDKKNKNKKKYGSGHRDGGMRAAWNKGGGKRVSAPLGLLDAIAVADGALHDADANHSNVCDSDEDNEGTCVVHDDEYNDRDHLVETVRRLGTQLERSERERDQLSNLVSALRAVEDNNSSSRNQAHGQGSAATTAAAAALEAREQAIAEVSRTFDDRIERLESEMKAQASQSAKHWERALERSENELNRLANTNEELAARLVVAQKEHASKPKAPSMVLHLTLARRLEDMERKYDQREKALDAVIAKVRSNAENDMNLQKQQYELALESKNVQIRQFRAELDALLRSISQHQDPTVAVATAAGLGGVGSRGVVVDL